MDYYRHGYVPGLMLAVTLLLFIPSLYATDPNTNSPCPSGWISRGRSCYFISDEKLTWAAARAKCLLLNSTLAVNSNPNENQFWKRQIVDKTRSWFMLFTEPRWWLGAARYGRKAEDDDISTDTGSIFSGFFKKVAGFFGLGADQEDTLDSKWIWEDWSTVPLTGYYWIHKPDDSDNLKCLMLRLSGLWQSENCAEKNYYICERTSGERYIQQFSERPLSLICPGEKRIKLTTWRIGPDWSDAKADPMKCPLSNTVMDDWSKAVSVCDGKTRCDYDFKAIYAYDVCKEVQKVSYLQYSCIRPTVCPNTTKTVKTWITRNRMCYGSHTRVTNSYESEYQCQTYSSLGHLLSILDPEENEWIKPSLSKFERIGFKRTSTGTGLRSMDGHEIDWSWASIPKTIRQTSCVFTVRLEGTSSVTWKADDCFKLSRFTCKIPDLSCTHPIGLEDGSFSDFQIGASSTPSWSHLPSSARLHNQNSAWCAGTGSYIQFTFLHPLHFFGIQTQGWQSSFVTSYNVSVLQNNAWSSVFNQNGGKVFPGNEDGEGVLTNFIHEPIEVEALRLHITDGNGAGDSTEGCLRVEILGCTDDGSWSDWSSWSTCSVSCGSGITKRTRFCNKPRPRLGGKDCAGDDTQTDTCIIHDCPVDGGWSCWGGWSPCIVRDDTVLLSKSRYRVCDNPAVANGGRECSGEPNEFAPCRQTVKAKKVFQTEISDCDFASSGYRLDNAAFLRVVNMSNCGLTNLPSDLLHRANNLEVLDLRQNNLNDFQIHQHKSSAIHLRHLLLDRNVEVDYVIVADHPQLRTDSDFRGVQINLGGSDVNDGQTENIPCNEPTDLTIVRDADDVITIRRFNFDLSHLNDYFWDTNLKKIRIHAISVTMTRDVSVHYDLEIVTSSFTMAENVGFLLDYEPTRSRMSGCSVQFMRARNCKRPTPQLLLLHYQTSESTIDILTRFIRSPFKCSVSNEPLKVPEFDDFQLKMSIFCARELHERANSSALAIAVLEHVISLSSRNIGPDFSALEIESEKFRIDWKPARGVTEHEIPTLSSNAQAQQMLRIAAILNEFDREISELENRNENEEIRLESARNMMRNQRNRIDLARANLGKKTQALRNSLLTLDKISSEFNRAILATEAPRANCEIHLKTSVTANILKSIGTFFSGKVVTSVQEISAQIGLLDLLDAIEVILDSVRKIVAAGNEALDAKTRYGVDFEDVEKGSELNVKMVVWDALSSTVDTHFDKEKVMALPGCAAFRKLLKDVTLWGKSMTQETITLAAVTNDFFLAEENADAEIRNYERFEIEFEAAFTKGSVTSELVVNARMQAYYYKEIAYDALHKFCHSFFYHYFIDCPRRVRPSIGDSLKTMSIKMNSAISLDFSRLYFDCFTKPVKFEIQLKDDERMNYSSVCATNECPIKHLRENREVYFELNPDDVTFIGYERIRVTEMRVFLTGIRPVKDDTVIRVSLSTASVFKDRYRYHDYQFRTTARKINFAYVVKTGVIKEHACMSGTYANLFTELPPFTRWKLEISERLNPSLDIRQLKSVSLFLLTHATNTAECDFNNNLSGYSSTRFDIGDKGNAPLSLECT